MALTAEESHKAEQMGHLLAAMSQDGRKPGSPTPTVMLGTTPGSGEYWRRVAEVVLADSKGDVELEYAPGFTGE